MPLAFTLFNRALLLTGGAIITASTACYYWNGMGIPIKSPAAEAENNNGELNGKIKALGITEGSCLLENNQTSRECTLNKEQMEKINFFEKEDGKEFPIEGLDNDKKMTLRIEKDYETSEFPSGLRLTFTNKNDGVVSLGEESDKTTFNQNVGRDYKIQGSDETKIMEAWTLQSLGNKVGLTIDSSDGNLCNLNENQNNTVNVWKNQGEYVLGAKTKNKCFMSVEKNSAGYMEGFKFTVSGETDIVLTEGEGPESGTKIEKITKDNVSYEIGPKDINGTKKWFLIERTS